MSLNFDYLLNSFDSLSYTIFGKKISLKNKWNLSQNYMMM